MKLLIITQKVNENDPLLGFMCRWISEFSKHFEKITVICLEKGEFNLPKNVEILSLGKENGKSRLKYIFNFYRYILSKRNKYDSVFVHMNQEYVILGGFLWKILGKPVFMWRNHYAGSFLTNMAASFCKKVFCTSKFSFTAKYPKTIFMPVGIDTTFYTPLSGIERIPSSILFLGRIAPSKRPDLLLEALGALYKRGIDFTADFYGSASHSDSAYADRLKTRLLELGLSKTVFFRGAISPALAPRIFSAHDVFVNLSPSGMYDKTIFEGASSSALTLASSADYAELVGEALIFTDGSVESLAEKIRALLNMKENEKSDIRRKLRTIAVEKQSLEILGKRLKEIIAD